MADYGIPKSGVAYVLYVGLLDQANTKVLKANPTIAAGDFKVSIDGGAFANLATLPAVTPAGGTAVKISLSAAEMTGSNIVVTCIDAAGAEWCDQFIDIQTSARGIEDLAYPATSGRSMVVDAAGLVDANAVKVGPTGAGTAQTARDIGASVLLSVGTGTGQVNLGNGVINATRTNTAQAGGATSITLDASASATDNLYVGQWVAILSGTGAGQVRLITAYVGASKVATVANWVTNPDATSVFAIFPAQAIISLNGNTAQTGDSFARLGAPAGASVSADVAAIQSDTNDIQARLPAALTADGNIKADTLRVNGTAQTAGDIPARLPAALVGGRMDASLGAVAAGVDLSATMKASVNTEVLDVLNVDTFAEPGQEAPAATNTLAKKIGYLFKFWRNRKTQTATAMKVYADDATTVDQKTTDSDDGTTFDRGEIGSGP